MPEISFEQAASELMKAFARGEKITPMVARCSGYDVQALQRCIDIFSPEIDVLPGYRPLTEWLSEREGTIFTYGEEDILEYKNVIRLMQLYVVGPLEDNRRVQTVGAYVSQNGEYIVAITEVPEAQRGDSYPKELEAHITPCDSATELAKALNPLLLQIERYENYLERYRIFSPLTFITERLIGLCSTQHATMQKRSSTLGRMHEEMQLTISRCVT